MVAATTTRYDGATAFPSHSHRWLPVDDSTARSSSSSGAPGGRACRLPPDVAIATGRAVRFADFSSSGSGSDNRSRFAPAFQNRPRAPGPSLAEGLGRAVYSCAVAPCVGAGADGPAAPSDEGRDDAGLRGAPAASASDFFRFDLEGLEGLLSCVPLEYDPRSPRGGGRADPRDGPAGDDDDASVPDGRLRDEAEYRLRSEREAIMSGAPVPFGPGGDGGDVAGAHAAGSLLRLVSGRSPGSPRSILRGATTGGAVVGGGGAAAPGAQSGAARDAVRDVPGGLFALASGEDDSAGEDDDAVAGVGSEGLGRGSGSGSVSEASPDFVDDGGDGAGRARTRRPPAGFRDLSSRSGDGGEGRDTAAAASSGFAGLARDDVLRAARLAVHAAIGRGGGAGPPSGGDGAGSGGTWPDDDAVEMSRSDDGAEEPDRGAEPPETPSRSRSREEGEEGPDLRGEAGPAPADLDRDDDDGSGLASLDALLRRGAEALDGDAGALSVPRNHGPAVGDAARRDGEDSRALNEHYDR